MKKIITSVGMIVFVAAIVAGGTGAFFSDTETSTGNVFTAGAIDLKVDSVAHVNGLVCFNGAWHPENIVVWNAQTQANELVATTTTVEQAVAAYNAAYPSNVPKAGETCKSTWALTDLEGEVAYRFFDYGDLKPGDNGENTISLHVFNNDAYMCATVNNVQDKDNTQTEPEADVDTDGLTSGELDSELEMVIWEDDGDNILEEGEEVLANTDNAQGIVGTYSLYTPQTGAIPATTTKYLGVYWCFGDATVSGTTISCNGASAGNVAQTDSLSADITFYVEQARNNSGFTCNRSTTTAPVTRLTLGKSILQDNTSPVDESLWTLTASGTTAGTGVISGIEASSAVSSAVVVAGSYALTESVVAGFTQTELVCGGTGVTLLGNIVTIPVGSSAVCTFTNTENTLIPS